jgi:asparagine synthase (glutamine-hydrolysing)
MGLHKDSKMCGILGIITPASMSVDLHKARRALALIRHRGPDDEGYLLVNYAKGEVVPCRGSDTDLRVGLPDIDAYAEKSFNILLGHRRLSIIDLSPLGHQPMGSGDGRYWIVYNGEVYNYLELKRELSQKGYLFKGTSDTEVILAAYQEWGSAMLNRFIGMFAFAILDLAEKTIFLARDFFGIKPLYYSLVGNRFSFASEIKPLLDINGVGRKGNPASLYEYLGFGLTDFGDNTMFAEIQQLPAANYAYVRLDELASVTPVRYWRINTGYRLDISFNEAVDRLRTLFAESTRLHMRSDVPVGACLSGGLDSSAIVMHMQRQQIPGQDLYTFSFIVDDPIISEERYVDIVGKAVGAVCHKISPKPEEMIADLEQLLCCQEEPFMSTSIYAQYRVFKLAHEVGIKVILDGQGADEIFAGYYNMIGARVTSLLSQGRFLTAWNVMQGAPKNMSAFRSRTLLFSLVRMLPPGAINTLVSLIGTPSFPGWVNQRWFLDRGVTSHYRRYGRGKHALHDEAFFAVDCLSLPQLLRYEDRNSMHFSIESRVPFCNPDIACFAMSLPEHFLISNDGTTKSVLRESLKGIVPEPVLKREKVGFATSQKDWLKVQCNWVRQTFKHDDIKALPFMQKHAFVEIVETTGSSKILWSTWAWRCLNLLYWSRYFDVEWD